MRKKHKNTSGVLGGAVAVIALVMLITVSVQNGAMKGLNGRDLMGIEPAAGEKVYDQQDQQQDQGEQQSGEEQQSTAQDNSAEPYAHVHDEEEEWEEPPPPDRTCGTYYDWIGLPVNEDKIKETGKEYRIIPLGGMVTADHNPERISVYLNEYGIVLDVQCD